MRITGGDLRSRRLVAPRSTATRPTQDRVREALFSILTSRGAFEGPPPRALDLYAGTGALGLEALSRGAAHCVFVEKARDALRALDENLRTLGVSDRSTVLRVPVDRALFDAPRFCAAGPFDLVFVDPPYAALAETEALLPSLAARLAPGATVVLEHASSDAAGEPPGLSLEDTRIYGDTALSLFAVSAQT
jgi:16S rRNA (guanine966-N2)-methyltransferase